MMMGSHSLKTICWYSATLILLASCKNKIRTRDKNISRQPGRRSRRSTWGSSSSARWPACCALSWRGCAARSGSAARSRGSRQQRNNPVKIFISVGIFKKICNLLLKIQLVVHLLATSTNVTAGHFSRRFPRTRWQRPLSTSLARLLTRGRGLKTCKDDSFFLQTTLSFPPGALR